MDQDGRATRSWKLRPIHERLRPFVWAGQSTRAGIVSAVRRTDSTGVPAVRATWRSAAELAVDELLLATQTAFRRAPDPGEVWGQLTAVEAAADALAGLEPRDLHQLVDSRSLTIVESVRRRGSLELLTLSASVDLPAVLMPSGGRTGDEAPVHATVRLLCHREPRPWVIVVHGAMQGRNSDIQTLRARHLHEQLGLNVALPVLPLHGPRRASPSIPVPGMDVLANVSTALIAVAEIRALRRWIGTEYDGPVGIFGVSLGGYIAALVAGVERDFDVAVAGIPVVNPHRLIARHMAQLGGQQGRELAALFRSPPVVALERSVDPLSFEPTVAVEHRHVLGGLLDRVTTPEEAVELARHWGVPQVDWYAGGHVGHMWSSALRANVDAALLELHSLPQKGQRSDEL